MLLAAAATLRGALMRRGSHGGAPPRGLPRGRRGADAEILYAKDEEEGMRLWTGFVGEIPQKVQAALAEEHEPNYTHLEKRYEEVHMKKLQGKGFCNFGKWFRF